MAAESGGHADRVRETRRAFGRAAAAQRCAAGSSRGAPGPGPPTDSDSRRTPSEGIAARHSRIRRAPGPGGDRLILRRGRSIFAAEIPEFLEITTGTAEGVVMAVEHRSMPVAGVQFPPESALGPFGEIGCPIIEAALRELVLK
ncbi:hypothetical protein AB0I49_10615 [Streptomyces sp. NPDC050617]|uniref:glutamine amidotransferase-related protein n=1 Tax=Streptomyces sp. NPDC050617 TaxID=3154628 RepID=UPI00344666BA